MQQTPIQVESYAGHKADETPRRFLIGGQWMEIVEVIDRWYQIESQPEWPRANYFKVRATDGRDYLLKHDQEADDWFLRRSWRVRLYAQEIYNIFSFPLTSAPKHYN